MSTHPRAGMAAAWPEACVDRRVLANRLSVALSTMRRLGLDGVRLSGVEGVAFPASMRLRNVC